jgi:hypothetical protein
MIVGYILELVLSIIFTITLSMVSPSSPQLSANSKMTQVAEGAAQSYFNCASFFTASIQLSSIVVLARRDFAVTAGGMGSFTVRITQSISLPCMLSLVGPLTALYFIEPKRSGYRLFMFLVCWLLYFYPFISRFIADFAPSQVGEGAGNNGTTIISINDWVTLEELCLAGVNDFTAQEERLLRVFGAAGSILVATLGMISILWYICKQHSNDKIVALKKKMRLDTMTPSHRRCLIVFVVAVVSLLTLPQGSRVTCEGGRKSVH